MLSGAKNLVWGGEADGGGASPLGSRRRVDVPAPPSSSWRL